MTHDQIAGTVTAWLRDDAESAVPDHLAAVLEQTRKVRQRPWWSSPGRWLPMDIPLRLSPASAPRFAWVLVVLALLLALVVAAALIGARPKVLEPFGPAANGVMAFGTTDGDIAVVDPATGSTRPLIAGATNDQQPYFSPDGTKFVFARGTCCNLQALTLAAADGTVIRTLAGSTGSSSVTWSPDGSSLAVVDSSTNSFSIVPIDGGPARPVALGLKADDILWRPNGREVVFRGVTSGLQGETYGLYLVGVDGTGLRAIVPPTTNDEHWQVPALSPDGRRILYTEWDSSGGHLYVVDIDSGAVQRLIFDPSNWSDYYAQWSPDGSRIVFHRGRAQESFHLAVAPARGGAVVDIGPEQAWTAAAAIAFSPDGTKVLTRFESGETWLFDAAGGQGQRLEIAAKPDSISWQRVAP